MGIYYYNENNFFNAIQAHEMAISREHNLLRGLHNIAVILLKIGLQRESLFKLNRSIAYFESGRTEKDIEIWKYYMNRATLFRMLGKEKAMQNDIQKSFQFKPNFASSWLQIGIHKIHTGQFEEAEEAYSNAIQSDPSRAYLWMERGKFYQLIGEHEKAITAFIRGNELSTKKTVTLYNLGMAYYLSGNIPKANEHYTQCINKGENFQVYSEAIFEFGIVLSIDKSKGLGFILGRTFFNDYDSIYFKLSDAVTIPVKGDRVKFSCSYQMHKMQYTASAKNITIDNTIIDKRFKNNKIYHAIISIKQNAFKSSNDCKYVEVFYPHSTILPFSLVEGKLDMETIKQLNTNGYAFVELVINFAANNIFELGYIKPIKYNNSHNNKVVSRSRTNRSYSSGNSSGRTCYVCGMDEWCGTDGCPSDPT
jgi:tetratricopeptide (TPR) repeat protein